MDLETDCLALESIEDNEVNPGRISHVDENKVKNNGSCANKLDSGENSDSNAFQSDLKREGSVESMKQVNSPPSKVVSPCGGSPPAKKGYGLKKWRRIRRDFVKDASASVDSSKILKRGLSGSTNPTKPPNLFDEIKQNSGGSVGSENMVKNVHLADGSATCDFAAATESENSEDQSSRSSTAASVPQGRYDMPAVMRYAREKNKMKNLSGKSSSNSVQRAQQGRNQTESSKKPRGERVKIEKENSHSSVESNSRSSNFVFMQGSFSVASNGKQSGRVMNYDGENSDGAQASEQQFSEEHQTAYSKENADDVENTSQDDIAANLYWEHKEDRNENSLISADRDPLVESILTLQSLQEALEKEVQKFGEIGKESISLHDNSINGASVLAEFTYNEPSSSEQLGSEKRHSASISMGSQVLSLKHKVKYLESKLEEARATLEVESSRVAELETALNSSKSPKKKLGSAIELQQEICREMEAEIEDLFKQKIEAEVEYLAMTWTIQNMGIAGGDQTALSEEQKNVARETGNAMMLKKQAAALENFREDILGSEEVLKMQRRVCKLTWFLFIQLPLLALVLCFFVLQLSPNAGVVVPT